MTTPDNLKYTKSHEWVRQEGDGTVTIGVTFHAQEMLGDVVFIENPVVGRKVKQGDECGVIESVKAAADLYAPLSGEVVAANGELADAPEKVNQDPYAAWMFRLKPDNVAELAGLLDAVAYQKIAEAEK
ncbi:MAG: glycine cleavage system protein H [Betaproteobacteria bacterium RIFCSPLOWO2_12_FULL_62_58]|nr:MAG: glycine cleavage system protein H [Betaproteobacteria bacterium RIFCSPLOWO2_02_FULL_62_79]OGA54221.1 MAG: glycine cleavage system protein H [Betaproteobacteria bacterium RIFCSPLOWO2_12_FULL_62_58]